jgi:hypothetical protein
MPNRPFSQPMKPPLAGATGAGRAPVRPRPAAGRGAAGLGAGRSGVMPLTAASCFGFTSAVRLL